MRFFDLLRSGLVGCVLALAMAGHLSAQDATPEATPGEASGDTREQDMLRDIPMDETFQGLRIPHIGPDGNVVMLLDTKSAKRVDDAHIEMDALRIEFTDDDGKTFTVTMPAATFNLDTRILSGNESVRIEREDFVIEGDSGEFDTRQRLGRVIGNVKMVILDTAHLENE